MTETNFRALCAELLTAIQLYTKLNPAASEMSAFELTEKLMDAMAATNAALAQPEPQGVRQEAILDWLRNDESWGTIVAPKSWRTQDDKLLNLLLRAIAHFGRPTIQPVPVSERLPGVEDCDSEGRCWFWCKAVKTWDFRSRNRQMVHDNHWLPHWALPVPTPANNTREKNLDG